MMYYFRVLLEFLRKKRVPTETKPNFNQKLIIAFASSLIIGLLVDKFIPFNAYMNSVRLIIAIVLGFSLFSFIYIMGLIQIETSSKEYDYTSVRRMFSYRQRVNLSILAGIVLAVFTLLTSQPSIMYTFKSGIAISLILGILTFVRPYRNEYMSAKTGLPDSRDVEFRERLRKAHEEVENKETEENDENKEI